MAVTAAAGLALSARRALMMAPANRSDDPFTVVMPSVAKRLRHVPDSETGDDGGEDDGGGQDGGDDGGDYGANTTGEGRETNTAAAVAVGGGGVKPRGERTRRERTRKRVENRKYFLFIFF